jgi:acetoin utilization deacetylase AcuC-like enzyme
LLELIKVAHSSIYEHSLPEGHRFPMAKYALIPQQLLYEGTLTRDHFFAPNSISEEIILNTHNSHYWKRLSTLTLSKAEQRRSGFPHNEDLINREMIITQGTLECAVWALENGAALNIAGGTHHAYADRAEGFCLLNDFAIALNQLLLEKHIKKALIVDLDVHQGNGTAVLFQSKPQVFTFSMHGEKNYPLRKERSDLDIPLPDGTDDNLFLNTLTENLPKLIQEQKPDIICYLSGVDPLMNDKLGRLGMSIQGLKNRDEFVFEQAYKNEIPIVVAMGGGYSERLSDIVEAHANTFRLAAAFFD